MASNISQRTIPPFYASAHDDVEYTFSFTPYDIDSVSNDGGFLKITLDDGFDVIPLIGEKITILGSVYNGTHTITSVFSTSAVTLNTPYITTVPSLAYFCYHLRIPNFSLYEGRQFGEGDDEFLPFAKVLDFKPILKFQVNGVPYLYVNLKGATKHLFNILANTEANSIDWSMVNTIGVFWDDLYTEFNAAYRFTFILNCNISNEDLFNKIGYGYYLTPLDKPIISRQGVSFASYIEHTPITTQVYPVIHKFINGVKV